MNITLIAVNGIAAAAVAAALVKDRKKAVRGIKGGLLSLLFLAPLMLLIVIVISMILTFLSPETIAKIIGDEAGIRGILTSTAVGGVIHIPAVIGFPIAASLMTAGASVAAAAAFITSLTMIGFVTLPLEIRELGVRFALLRNLSAVVLSVCIALLMGVIL
ncbi:MAG: permease [Spirochaetia bacterium]